MHEKTSMGKFIRLAEDSIHDISLVRDEALTSMLPDGWVILYNSKSGLYFLAHPDGGGPVAWKDAYFHSPEKAVEFYLGLQKTASRAARLVKLAEHFDSMGDFERADEIDSMIRESKIEDEGGLTDPEGMDVFPGLIDGINVPSFSSGEMTPYDISQDAPAEDRKPMPSSISKIWNVAGEIVAIIERNQEGNPAKALMHDMQSVGSKINDQVALLMMAWTPVLKEGWYREVLSTLIKEVDRNPDTDTAKYVKIMCEVMKQYSKKS